MDVRANRDTFKQLVDFLIRHLLSQLCEHISELSGTNVSVPLLVKHLETTDELLCDTLISLTPMFFLNNGGTWCTSRLEAIGAV